MSTQKHTQGPWMVSNGLPTVWANNGERQIADCDKGPLRSAEEDLANARLISAAPDLLQVTKDFLLLAALHDWEGAAIDFAKATLAKAEGVQ